MYYVGLDVHYRTSTYCILNATTAARSSVKRCVAIGPSCSNVWR